MDMSSEYRLQGYSLSSRTFARLSELLRIYTVAERKLDVVAAGFDGLTMLNTTEEEWRTKWQVIYPPARADLMLYMEKLWRFKRALPCPAGSYCNAGMCARYVTTGRVEVNFDAASSSGELARRLDVRYRAALVANASAPSSSSLRASSVRNATRNATLHPGAAFGAANFSEDSAPTGNARGDAPAHANESTAGCVGCEDMLGAVVQLDVELSAAGRQLRRPLRELYGLVADAGKVAAVAAWSAQRSTTWGDATAERGFNATVSDRFPGSPGAVRWLPQNASVLSGFTVARRLQSAEPLTLINPLAMSAPQECVAGTFCNERAGSSDGTGLCPPGKFCAPGSGEPQQAPEGVFVSGAGSVRGLQCFPGQFAPFADTPKCFPCPPGSSCPDFGTIVASICPPGTFREPQIGNASSTTISCEPCGPGTWSPWRGTPDWSSCEPCPDGRVCPVGMGNISEGTTCPEGYICGEGTTPDQQTSTKCYDGFVCNFATTPVSVYKSLCLAGFYCGELTTYSNRYKFRCPEGFYCPMGTGFRKDLNRLLIKNVVFIGPREFYFLQKLAQYCVRQRMLDIQKMIYAMELELVSAGLPALEDREKGSYLEVWYLEFSQGRVCQKAAVQALYPNASAIASLARVHSVGFLESQLLKGVGKAPGNYTNKCSRYSPDLGGPGFPPQSCTSAPCPNVTQLECLCTTGAENMEARSLRGSPVSLRSGTRQGTLSSSPGLTREARGISKAGIWHSQERPRLSKGASASLAASLRRRAACPMSSPLIGCVLKCSASFLSRVFDQTRVG